ncbi:MAG: response regulator [Cyclobacteriaceae bacterium]
MNKIDRVFLVDDDRIFLSLAKLVLQSVFTEADIVIAKNGLEGLKNLEEKLPNLLFLDINMPVMDGWEFLTELGKQPGDPPFQIIITSSSVDPEDRQRAEGHPLVNGFIEKPITKEKILSVVS